MAHALTNIFSGEIGTFSELKTFFLEQRRQFKHEFYLPTVKQFFHRTFNIVGDILGRRISELEEMMGLSNQELYRLVSALGIFGRSLSHINEAYYVSGVALRALGGEFPGGFKTAAHLRRFREVFEKELRPGRIVRYPEGSRPPWPGRGWTISPTRGPSASRRGPSRSWTRASSTA